MKEKLAVAAFALSVAVCPKLVNAQDQTYWVGNTQVLVVGADRISLTVDCEANQVRFDWVRRPLGEGESASILVHNLDNDVVTSIDFNQNPRARQLGFSSDITSVHLQTGRYAFRIGDRILERTTICNLYVPDAD